MSVARNATDETRDLDAAVKFAIGRVEEQAKQSGEPLTEAQRLLLDYLPTTIPFVDPEFPTPVPRNINLERLCSLGRAARLKDLQLNQASLEWAFAFAVLKLHKHPMWGLLHYAGVRHRRTRWDYVLLLPLRRYYC